MPQHNSKLKPEVLTKPIAKKNSRLSLYLFFICLSFLILISLIFFAILVYNLIIKPLPPEPTPFPTPTPTPISIWQPSPTPYVTPRITPVSNTSNLLTNGDLERDDFGKITSWSQTNITLARWYLVQDDIGRTPGVAKTRWVERVKFEEVGEDRTGFGLKSIDNENCDSFCSASAVQIVPAQPGKFYTLSAAGKRVEGTGGTIYLDFLTKDKARIEAKTRGGYQNGVWTTHERTEKAPPETSYIRVILYSSNNAQGVIYWDDVELKERL